MKPTELLPLLKDTWTAFSETKCARLAAALSFYTIFSIAPILIVILSLAALFLDPETVRRGILEQIGEGVNSTAATAVADILSNAKESGKSGSIFASIAGFATILVGATGLFAALQDSLNTIWGVEPKPNQGFITLIRTRLLSFVMVLGIGFLLVVSLVLSVAVKAFSLWLSPYLGGAEWIAPTLNIVVSFVVLTGFFAAMFKVLPDAEIQWRDVWVGSAVTSILFSVGKFILSWYLSRPDIGSAYGSAGALVVLLLWINYAGQILFFGAEFTKVYANRFGSHIEPEEHAQEILPEKRAAQGIKPEPAHAGAQSAATRESKANGKSNGKVDPKIANMTPAEKNAKIAELRAEAKKNFEFSMAVVAGGLAAVVWALKKRESENHKTIARRDAETRRVPNSQKPNPQKLKSQQPKPKTKVTPRK